MDKVEKLKTKLMENIKNYNGEETTTILKAIDFSSEIHKDVYCQSGDPYITHPLSSNYFIRNAC